MWHGTNHRTKVSGEPSLANCWSENLTPFYTHACTHSFCLTPLLNSYTSQRTRPVKDSSVTLTHSNKNDAVMHLLQITIPKTQSCNHATTQSRCTVLENHGLKWRAGRRVSRLRIISAILLTVHQPISHQFNRRPGGRMMSQLSPLH
jgi:hypothetical protein